MKIEQNISLKPYHSFGCQVAASYFTRITEAAAIPKCIEWSKAQNIPLLFIGAGSNLLFTKDVNALVAKVEISGIKKIEETATKVILSVGAGENWHHFVSYCVQKSWGGIENLSLIPGTVGASPIQNIGAYGVEVQEVIDSVTAYDTMEGKWVELKNKDCAFEYRNSIFKKEKGRFIIATVNFILQKQPKLRTDYGAIRDALHEKGIKHPNLESMANVIIQIRSGKLPNPKQLGNAGSFFKNPTISKENFEQLKEKFPSIVAYPIADTTYKVAAGWLIESCEWKGTRKGNVGCYDKQALVLVNYGEATGQEIFDFSEEIIQSVYLKFGILLEREVNII
jgi:UDP-N-acetylmuramate dehydrogenase